MEVHPGHMHSSRVLPVVPVLPRSAALIGQDPYDCELTLNPRYRDASDLADSGASAEEVSASAEDTAEEIGVPSVDTDLHIQAPRPLRHLPLVPLQI
jgi:hypothetical protein